MAISKYIDFLGLKPCLLLEGSSRHTTFFGSAISVMVFGFTLGFSLYFFIGLFQREHIVVNQNQGKMDFPSMDISNMPFMFKMVDGALTDVGNASRYFQFQVVQGYSPGYGAGSTYLWSDLEPCNISKHFGKYADHFEKIPFLSSYTCVSNLSQYNWTLYGTYGDSIKGFSHWNLLINMCNNDTSNGTCATRSEITDKLKAVFLSFGFLDNLVDHNNIDSPSNITLNIELMPFSATVFTRYYFFKRTVSYETDYGFVFPDNKKEKFFQQDDRQTYVDLSVNLGGDTSVVVSGVKFGHVSLHMNQVKYSFNRSYMKIQEMMASIGGVISAISFIGYLFVNFIGKKMYNIRLANVFFQFNSRGEKSPLRRQVSEVLSEVKTYTKIACQSRNKMEESEIKTSHLGNRFIKNMNSEDELVKSVFHQKKENWKKINAPFNKTTNENVKLIENEGCFIEKDAVQKSEPNKQENQNPQQFMELVSTLGMKDVEMKQIPELEKSKKLTMTKGDMIIPEEISVINNDDEKKDKNNDVTEKNNQIKDKKSLTGALNFENFENRVDENGKLKINFRNIFFPNKEITKIHSLIDKKISIDEILKYCSQIEKLKNYLFDEEELVIFNHLPDLDVSEVINHRQDNIKYIDSIRKKSMKTPESKLLKLMIN